MENEKNKLPEDNWFDNLISPDGTAEEIKADEKSSTGSDLTDIGDMEL